MRRTSYASPALVALLVVAATALASCNENLAIENAATDPAELARYFPENTDLVQTTDVAEVRQELGLPEDADATPIDRSVLRDRESPQSKLFALTSRAFPVVLDAYLSEPEVAGTSPLDGTLIRAAAHDSGELTIVSTEEPFNGVVDKLERTGYSLAGGLYIAGPDTPKAASPVVADGAGGRVVFAGSRRLALKTLRRIEERAEPGAAAESLHAVSGSVKLATTGRTGGSRCVEALAAAQSGTGKGAIMALVISGDKPDPNRFDPSGVRSLDVGTTSVLVDALLVPFNVAKPMGKAAEPITELLSHREPFDAYDCP